VKLSLFLLYLRLFKPNRITRWLIYGGIIACGIFYSFSLISNSALCMPKPGQPNDAAHWLLRTKDCSKPSQHLAIAQAAFGTLSDFYLLVIPIHSIFQLNLPTRRKIGVSAIFLVGIMSVLPPSHSCCNRIYIHFNALIAPSRAPLAPSRTVPDFSRLLTPPGSLSPSISSALPRSQPVSYAAVCRSLPPSFALLRLANSDSHPSVILPRRGSCHVDCANLAGCLPQIKGLRQISYTPTSPRSRKVEITWNWRMGHTL